MTLREAALKVKRGGLDEDTASATTTTTTDIDNIEQLFVNLCKHLDTLFIISMLLLVRIV